MVTCKCNPSSHTCRRFLSLGGTIGSYLNILLNYSTIKSNILLHQGLSHYHKVYQPEHRVPARSVILNGFLRDGLAKTHREARSGDAKHLELLKLAPAPQTK